MCYVYLNREKKGLLFDISVDLSFNEHWLGDIGELPKRPPITGVYP